jgi:hypothetical protein
LESLIVEAIGYVNNKQLRIWEAHTDFSLLRCLRLPTGVDLDALRRLAELAKNQTFSSLRELEITVSTGRGENAVFMSYHVGLMLCSLRPLEVLSLTNFDVATWRQTVVYHSVRLRSLRIRGSALSTDVIDEISQAGSNVEDMEIEILRSQGDDDEVRKYHALGSMSKLKHLTLILRCSSHDRHGSGPVRIQIVGFTRDPVVRRAMRDILVNAAMDERLARSIFSTIATANAAMRHSIPPSISLVRLEMDTTVLVDGYTVDADFDNVVRWIARSWVCKRDPRDTHHDEIHVKEIGKRLRHYRGNDIDPEHNPYFTDESFIHVWKALWPETGLDWRHDWRSFPLAEK